MQTTIKLVEDVLRDHGQGRVWVPDKINCEITYGALFEKYFEGFPHFIPMPAYIASTNIIGIKWIGSNWANMQQHGLPTIIGLTVLNDPATLMPLAILGAGWLTAMRTGAASAVAAKYLARKDSEIACIIGAGYQSRFQLEAISNVLKLTEVRIVDIRRDAMESFVKDMAKFGLKIIAEPSREKAVRDSDIVIPCTSADLPMVRKDWLKKGVFISSIGTYGNLDYDVVKSMNKIVVDHLQETKHVGELTKLYSRNLISEREIYAELGDIVFGKKAGRESSDEDILAVPIGIGSEDVAVAYEAYKLAKNKGIGQRLIWNW